MNNQNQIKTHFDSNVIIFFAFLFIISCILLAFKNGQKEECTVDDFKIEGDLFAEGELLTFSENTEGTYAWRWYFGDGSDISFKSKVAHVFKKPGIYKVKLLLNNSCEIEKNIKISAKKIIVEKKLNVDFSAPSRAVTGQKLKFSDRTENATSWEWRFGETDVVDSRSKHPTYAYKKIGVKTVSLVVNGDKKNVKFNNVIVAAPDVIKTPKKAKVNKKIEDAVEVAVEAIAIPKEVVPVPKEVVVKTVSESELEALLYAISDGKLTYEGFKNNFCSEPIPVVQINGVNKNITLKQFYNSIVNKGIKIKGIKINKEKNNCINLILINYKLKTFF